MRPSRAAIRWLTLGIALFLLNAAVTFQNVWPTPLITTRHELSIELAALLLVLAAYAELVRPPGRVVWTLLTVLLFVMAVGRYAEVTAPALYGRPVNLYWDSQNLPNVAAMLAKVAPTGLLIVAAVALVALVVGVVAALWWALGRVADGLRAPPMRRAMGVLALGIVTLYAASRGADWPAQYWFSLPVTKTYWQQFAFIYDARSSATARSLPIAPLAPSNLKRLDGADVLLMFLESYGAVTYDMPSLAALATPARAATEAAAAATGRRVVSAFVESPTFGGLSWLAHSSLLSGFEVREPGNYSLLLTQQRETLASRFEASGYRAIAVMPGLKDAWPEGSFYHFDAIYGDRDLDYRGPEFGWWRIPDQYSLAKLDAAELGPSNRKPLFAFFPTVNTHMPFRPTPPYQPDWQRLLGSEPYDPAAAAASIAHGPDWTHLSRPYGEAVAYTFTYLAGYLRERATADFVLVLLGDHQPAAEVSGPSARWDVPVHVITRNAAIADSLRSAGFIEGMGLQAGQKPIADMAALTTLLLRAFDAPAEPASQSAAPPKGPLRRASANDESG